MHPAKAVGWNQMTFGRETCVVPSNVLDSSPTPHGNLGSEPAVRSDATYCQITLAFVFIILTYNDFALVLSSSVGTLES